MPTVFIYNGVMNPELITRLVKLVEKTGDRVILPDLESGKAVVVMDLDAYEHLCAPGVERTAAVAAPEPMPKHVDPPTEVREELPTVEKPPLSEAVTAALAPIDAVSANKPENKAKTKGLQDLTQEELLDKINRDIDAWKTAQDTKRTEELQSAARDLPAFAAATQLEEEERFFLEPIE